MGRSGSKKSLASSMKTRQIVLGSGASLSYAAPNEIAVLKKVTTLQGIAFQSGRPESVTGEFKLNNLGFVNTSFAGLDFYRKKISDTSFNNVDFSKPVASAFKQSEIENVTGANNNFSGCDFSHAGFSNTRFSETDFSGCDFSHVDLRDGSNVFEKCNFSKARIAFKNDIKGNDFSGSTFLNTQFLRGTDFSGAKLSDALVTTDAERLVFTAADLSGTEFLNCSLKNSFFGEAVMSETEFKNDSNQHQKNKIIVPTFSYGILNEVSFKNVTLIAPHFNRSYLNGNTFTDTVITDARVGYAALSDTTFRGSTILNTDFSSSKFSKTRFIHCDLTGSVFGKDLEGIEFINCIGGPKDG